MRRQFHGTFLVLLMLIVGCASHPPASHPTGDGEADAGSEEARSYPLVKPVLLMPGKVVSFREQLRFAVLDFGIHPLPVEGTVLEVRRLGVKVGELRVSGPNSASRTVADLVAGQVAPGDEVHPLASPE